MTRATDAGLAASARIVIAGGTRCGKSTLALELCEQPMCGDDVKHLGWSESSAEVATWFDKFGAGPWLIEGSGSARALRKWLEAATAAGDHISKPCDVVIVLDVAHAELTKDQAAMNKGCVTVFSKIEHLLRARGVRIQREWPRVVVEAELARAAS